jgi:DNA processing protein
MVVREMPDRTTRLSPLLDPAWPKCDPMYWVAFNHVRGIGPVRFRQLLQYFQGDLARAWQADARELACAGLDAKAINYLLTQRPAIHPERKMAELVAEHIQVLTWQDAGYPALLREIDSSPPVLYLRGTLTAADQFALAVVGTRNASQYGKQATTRLVSELARGQVTIVSGLALGIDTQAHSTALDAGGRTLAVLACGLNVVYPMQNARLARRIVESGQGALISDYPPDMHPESNYFPARNRIISGLAQGVLVVEAGEQSGALITANFALKQGREVFAVPGGIFSTRSLGVNKLIQHGAHPVVEVRDILETLNLFMLPQQVETQQALPANATECTLLNLLSYEPLHVNELIVRSALPAPTVVATLTVLELKGLVKAAGNTQFVLAR